MKSLQKSAIVLKLIDQLKQQGSWCGETHVQKSVYFLEDLLEVPLGFEFVLYKYGPFSFDLSDHLFRMKSDGVLDVVPQSYPYGPSLALGDISDVLIKMFPKTLKMYSQKIDFVAEKLGTKNVGDLEKLATALFVTKHGGDGSSSEMRSKQLRNFKPHVSEEDAIRSIGAIDIYLTEVVSVAN